LFGGLWACLLQKERGGTALLRGARCAYCFLPLLRAKKRRVVCPFNGRAWLLLRSPMLIFDYQLFKNR
jgi:hypothetical protein